MSDGAKSKGSTKRKVIVSRPPDADSSLLYLKSVMTIGTYEEKQHKNMVTRGQARRALRSQEPWV